MLADIRAGIKYCQLKRMNSSKRILNANQVELKHRNESKRIAINVFVRRDKLRAF